MLPLGPALLAAFLAARTEAVDPLRVMTYNILFGQPCTGGSLGEEVVPRMELAVQGGNPAEPGLVALAPDILGMQEVSQVFRDQPVSENSPCQLGGGAPPGLETIVAYEHQADTLLRRMNGVTNMRGVENLTATSVAPTSASPYAMEFRRDMPRLIPLIPDVALPTDQQAASDLAADLANFEFGLVVLSRFRIQFVTVHNLTFGSQPGESRAIIHATLRDDASGRAYDFYDSHLTTTGGDSPQTLTMAGKIIEFIVTTRRHPQTPAFFTCDCNAEPDSQTHVLFNAAGFVDSFGVRHPGVAGFTSGRDGLATDCGQAVDSRIDYVWAIPDDQGRVPGILSSDVVMDYAAEIAPGVCRFPSDHNAVLTVFDMANLAPPGEGDADGDGVLDASDNCPFRANPNQEDTGGIGSAEPDGIGNACQCGEVTGEGVVNGQDGVFITRHGLGYADALFAVPGNCDVTGNGRCNGQDGVFVTRAGLGYTDPPHLAPSAQNCQNADPFAPPCTNCE